MSLLAVKSVTRRSVCSVTRNDTGGSSVLFWSIKWNYPGSQNNALICNPPILSTSQHWNKDSSRFCSPFSFFVVKYLLFTIVRISCNINTTARTQHTKRGQETLILPSYSWLMGIYGGLEKNWTLDKNDNKPFLNWLIHYLNYY